MQSLLNRSTSVVLADRTLGRSWLFRNRTLLLILIALLTVVLTGLWLLRPAAPVNLVEAHNLRKTQFYTHWAKGELVVVLRHAERCDHSTNPCLGPADGITRKGQAVAIELGQSLQTMGLGKTDIFNSPLTRTAQTSSYAFNKAGVSQDWLFNCRHNMLADVLAHKTGQRNLILVTHSECIDALEKSLNVSSRSVLDYASALVVAVNPVDHTAHVLGLLDAPDWKTVTARRP